MAKKIISYIVFLVFITSCDNNCKEIPNNFSDYEQGKKVVLSSNFQITDEADVSDSSWITSAKYLSCDGLVGFFIIETDNRTYIHHDISSEIWEDFKKADSKGSFYNRNIKGNYQLKLQ